MTELIAAALAFFVVAVSPGPANLSNAAIAMAHGRRTSLIYGLGLSCGLVFWDWSPQAVWVRFCKVRSTY